MSWTRRAFLTRSAALGAALAATAGCSTRLGGTPRPDPARSPADAAPATPTSSAPARPPLRLGIVRFQPYTVEENGEPAGPIPDVARAALSRMGVEDIEITLLREEAELLVGVAAGRFDVVGGLAVRPDLCARLRYSVPDTVSGTALIVPTGNPRRLTTYAEVVAAGATVAVMTGLPEHQDALRAGVPAANLVELPVPHQLVDAVRNGQADCAAFDDITARDMARTLGDGEVGTAEPFPPPGRPPLVCAYGFAPESAAELLEPFNAALRALHDDGGWLELVEPYGFTSANDPAPDLTVERLCAG